MIITELFNNTKSLTELAPGGSDGNGPFDYGSAIIKMGETFVDVFADSAAGEDAAMIMAVGETFMTQGMMPGIKALFELDTQVYDHVLDELADQGFNVDQDIIARRREIPRDPEAGRLFAKARAEWEAQPGDMYVVTGRWGKGSSVDQDIKAKSAEEARKKFLASNPQYDFTSVDVKRRGGAAGVSEGISVVDQDLIMRETARTGKKSTARIDRILQLLRARNPQAQNDLEALILDFRSQQAQDRRDISSLYAENDMEEADIARLEALLDQIRRHRTATTETAASMRHLGETKKKPQPTNPELWSRAKSAARSKFDVWPSAYASAWAAKYYKSKGGGWRMGKAKKKD